MLSDPWENLTPVSDASLSGGDVRWGQCHWVATSTESLHRLGRCTEVSISETWIFVRERMLMWDHIMRSQVVNRSPMMYDSQWSVRDHEVWIVLLWSMICAPGKYCGVQITRCKSVVGLAYGSTQGSRGNKNEVLHACVHAYSHTYMRTMSVLHLPLVWCPQIWLVISNILAVR